MQNQRAKIVAYLAIFALWFGMQVFGAGLDYPRLIVLLVGHGTAGVLHLVEWLLFGALVANLQQQKAALFHEETSQEALHERLAELLPSFASILDMSDAQVVLRSFAADTRSADALDTITEDTIATTLIHRIAVKAHASRSVEATAATLEQLIDRADETFATDRAPAHYLLWALPSVGFMGTVIGIGAALGAVSPDQASIAKVTQSLQTAFDTTFLALVLSLIGSYLLSRLTIRQERFCLRLHGILLDSFVNRLRLEESPERHGS